MFTASTTASPRSAPAPCCARADFLLAISEDLRKRIVAMGAPPERTRSLVSGCDLSVFHPMDRVESAPPVAHRPCQRSRRLHRPHGRAQSLRELVEAAVTLHPVPPNLHVYLIGAGSDRPIVEAAIQTGNAAGYVHALPECSFDEVAVWMTAADLVTLPSYMEGCPNVVLEALACGRPVVATTSVVSRSSCLPRLVDRCGRLVPPATPQPWPKLSPMSSTKPGTPTPSPQPQAVDGPPSRRNSSKSWNPSSPPARQPATPGNLPPKPPDSQDCCIVYFTPATENGPASSCYGPTAESGLSAVIRTSLSTTVLDCGFRGSRGFSTP